MRSTLRVLVATLLLLVANTAMAATGRYRITLDLAPQEDAAQVARQIEAITRGKIESAPGDGSASFVLVASDAAVKTISTYPRVAAVEDLGPTPASSSTWTTGTYAYDGSGNVKSITRSAFTERYVYDAFGRLASGTAGPGRSQAYTYDRFGNLLTITTDAATTIKLGIDSESNQMDETGSEYNITATYDDAGRLTAVPSLGYSFTYDGLDTLIESTVDQRKVHLYTASDERVASVSIVGGAPSTWEWTIRDPEGKVLRRLTKAPGGTLTWAEDYIYRGSQMLAAEVTGGEKRRQFHSDHLGTPRLITGNGGTQIGLHSYYPFGVEVTSGQEEEKKKFTGHERDSSATDYMHARYYSPGWGRFLSVDPYLDIEQTMKNPQKWNRYAYVRNNPIRYTDPTGMDEDIGPETATIVNNSQQTVWIAFDADQMGPGGTNLDVRIPLKPGESSAKFTTDADAVIVAPGQKINGESGGAFKVRFGTVTVEGGKKGELKLQTNVVQKADPGQGHQQKPQQQWALRKEDVKNQDKTRQETARTKPERERRIKEREERKPWWRIF